MKKIFEKPLAWILIAICFVLFFYIDMNYGTKQIEIGTILDPGEYSSDIIIPQQKTSIEAIGNKGVVGQSIECTITKSLWTGIKWYHFELLDKYNECYIVIPGDTFIVHDAKGNDITESFLKRNKL